MSNRGYALSRFSGDKVAYCAKCFLGLYTKSTSIFDYKWDEIAVIELLVRGTRSCIWHLASLEFL